MSDIFDDFFATFDEPNAPVEPATEPDRDENDIAVDSAASAVKSAENELATFKNEAVSANEEIARIEKQLAALKGAKEELSRKIWDARSKVRQAEKDYETAKTNKQLAVEAKQAAARFAEQATSYDAIASTKKWKQGVQVNGETYTIKEHQYFGAKWLASAETGAFLGDEMGLGKTLTVIAGLDLVKSKKSLIVCQADITTNFLNEIVRWTDRPVVNIRGEGQEERNAILMTANLMDDAIVVINYEAWRKDISLIARLAAINFDSIVLDESHNVKETRTSAYKGIKAVASAINECPRDGLPLQMATHNGVPVAEKGKRGEINIPIGKCVACGWNGQAVEGKEGYYDKRSVKRVWCVTGTPILNQPEELFSQLHLIDPESFPSMAQYKNQFLKFDYATDRWVFQSGGAESLLNHKLKGKYLSRDVKDAGIELPPQDIVYHDIAMDKEKYPAQYELIKQLQKFSAIVLEGGKMSIVAQIALYTRQRQANVWPGGIEWKIENPATGEIKIFKVAEEVQDSIKLDKAREIISNAIDAGKKVVLFSQFTTALDEAYVRFNNFKTPGGNVIKPVLMTGKSSQEMRAQVKHEWDRNTPVEPAHNLVLANYKVGGTGLNLTKATVTVILDSEWNPGRRDQAYARTNRIGQTEDTIVHIIRVNGTIDAWMDSLMDAKEELIGDFNSTAEDAQQAYLKAIASGEIGI